MFLTFSARPSLNVLKGDLRSKLRQLETADWGMNTNLHAAFDEVLRVAVKGKVKAADMPKYLLIMSDMEFDRCTQFDDSAMQMIQRKFEAAGYEVPKIVFWNLNARAGNVPVKYNMKNVALVSGFSPSIMTAVLGAKDMSPVSVMLETLNSERYAAIK